MEVEFRPVAPGFSRIHELKKKLRRSAKQNTVSKKEQVARFAAGRSGCMKAFLLAAARRFHTGVAKRFDPSPTDVTNHKHIEHGD